jgi:hypothetical protein
MADASAVSVDSSLSLADLNRVAQQQEQLLGPLVLIGNDGSNNLLSFDMERDPPNSPIQIQLISEPTPPNAQIVSTGLCLIQKAITNVIAFRAA